MKTIILSIIVTVFFCSSVYSGEHKMFAQGRVDYVKFDGDGTKNAMRTPNYERFQVNKLRFNNVGSTGAEGLDYRFRISVKNDGTSGTNTDGTSAEMDYWYLTKSFDWNGSLSAGKVSVYAGGNEFWPAGYDVYTYSLAAGNDFHDGVGIVYNQQYMGQTFVLNIVNPDNVNSRDVSRGMAYGVHYRGNLMNGMIVPTLHYSVTPDYVNPVAGTSDGRPVTDKNMVVAVQLNVKNITVEADYNVFTEEDKTTMNKDDETTSIVGLVRYTHGNWKPFVKYIMDEVDVSGVKSYEKTSYNVGVEYWMDSNSRVHFVYTSEDFDYVTSSGTTLDHEETKMILGWRTSVRLF